MADVFFPFDFLVLDEDGSLELTLSFFFARVSDFLVLLEVEDGSLEELSLSLFFARVSDFSVLDFFGTVDLLLIASVPFFGFETAVVASNSVPLVSVLCCGRGF